MSHYPALAGRASSTHFTTHVMPPTTVADCEKQVRSWRFLRSLSDLLIPSCNCTTFYNDQNDDVDSESSDYYIPSPPKSSPRSSHRRSNSNPFATTPPTTTVIGTIYGSRSGKVKFCIQTVQNAADHPNKMGPAGSIPPILLLLELAVPTSLLAKEMRGGVLRIALECSGSADDSTRRGGAESASNNNKNTTSLLSVPVWTMYCNGRRVGFAGRRHPGKTDMEFLRKMGTSVTSGAGVISGKELGCTSDNDVMTKDVMYLRGKFERVRGSRDAESFHLINDDSAAADGCINQDLSVFFLRSR